MNDAGIQGLDRLERTLDALTAGLSDQGRRALLAKLGRKARALNAGRIAAQTSPDGAAFEPRKMRSGRRRGKMFVRLKAAKWLRMRAFPERAIIDFKGSAAHIARVHHFGLRDKIDPKRSLTVKYPARELLGVADHDIDVLEDILYEHVAGALK